METSRMALEAARMVGETGPFMTREISYDTVKRLYPNEEIYRLQDVGKFLSFIWNELYNEATMSDGIRRQLEERKKNRNGYKLVLKDSVEQEAEKGMARKKEEIE